MSSEWKAEVEVNVERLNSDVIDDHLRSSTAVLHDILSGGDRSSGHYGHTCHHCKKLYKSASTLQSHCLLKHPEGNVEFQCVSCDKKYPSILSLQKHARYMHRYNNKCQACYRSFATPELLEEHKQVLCPAMETPCGVCGRTYGSQVALRNHMKYKHPMEKTYFCEQCRRTFRSERSLTNHKAVIHPPEATFCSWCNRNFNSRSALQSHNMYRHNGSNSQESTASDSKRPFDTLTHICGICNRVFQRTSELVQHAIEEHTSEKNEKCVSVVLNIK